MTKNGITKEMATKLANKAKTLHAVKSVTPKKNKNLKSIKQY